MLLGDPEGVFANHEAPAYRGVPRGVWTPVSQLQRGQCRAPSLCRDLKIPERLAGLLEKHVVVSDGSGGLEAGAQSKLPFENRECSQA